MVSDGYVKCEEIPDFNQKIVFLSKQYTTLMGTKVSKPRYVPEDFFKII